MLETEEVVKHMKIPVGTNRKVVHSQMHTQLSARPASNETQGKVHRNEAALSHLVLCPHSSGPFLFMNIPCDGQRQKQHS